MKERLDNKDSGLLDIEYYESKTIIANLDDEEFDDDGYDDDGDGFDDYYNPIVRPAVSLPASIQIQLTN